MNTNQAIKIENSTNGYEMSAQLHDIIKDIVIPNSSMGVHNISLRHFLKVPEIEGMTNFEICDRILETGLKRSKDHDHMGLASTIKFCGFLEDNETLCDIMGWGHGPLVEKNNIKLIIAIPEEITIDGSIYKIGKFPKYKSDLVKFYDALQPIKFNNIPILPREFIVGYLTYDLIDYSKAKYGDFIFRNFSFHLNPNYIGLIDSNDIDDETKKRIIKFSEFKEKETDVPFKNYFDCNLIPVVSEDECIVEDIKPTIELIPVDSETIDNHNISSNRDLINELDKLKNQLLSSTIETSNKGKQKIKE